MHLGIDLGGTKTEIIALDTKGTQLQKLRIPSPQDDYESTLSAIIQLIKDMEHRLPPSGKEVTEATIGIGIPGCISPQTHTVKNANSSWLIGHPLQLDLEKRLNRPVTIANDADCFALSEAIDGTGSKHHSVFGVILGTGVGGGLVINRQLVQGPNSICGEWGHNPLPWQSEVDRPLACYCGKNGCIETFISGPAWVRHYQRDKTANENINSAEDLIAAYRNGEHAATLSFERYIDQLARALASLINIIDPDIIVFGGGLSNIEELYPALPQDVAKYIFSDSVETQFAKAKHGDSSGVRGAAWLGAGRILSNDN